VLIYGVHLFFMALFLGMKYAYDYILQNMNAGH